MGLPTGHSSAECASARYTVKKSALADVVVVVAVLTGVSESIALEPATDEMPKSAYSCDSSSMSPRNGGHV